MDTRTLELFLHLSETLHFGRTSRECFISPSALSRQIMRLEEDLGQRLYIRDNRRVELTRAGKIFRDHAARVMGELNKARESLRRENREPRGRIRLFCSVTACYSFLPGLIPPFRKRYPGIRIDLHTGDAASAIPTVLSGEADVAVAALPDSLPGGLAFRELTTTPLVFVAPRFAEGSGDIASVDQVAWDGVSLVLSEKEPARKRAEGWCVKHGINPPSRSFVSGNEALLAMVALGLGVGVVPRLVVEKSPVRSEVTVLTGGEDLGVYTVGLCAFKRNLSSPSLRALWEEVE